MRQPEKALTYQFFRWLFYQYRDIYEVSFHIANEGKRSRINGHMSCLKKGVPDIFISHSNNKHNGLYIEMKIKPNKPSIDQLSMIKKLRDKNYCVEICYTLDEAMQCFKNYIGEEDDKQPAVSNTYNSARA